jgi:hypothetical protein
MPLQTPIQPQDNVGETLMKKLNIIRVISLIVSGCQSRLPQATKSTHEEGLALMLNSYLSGQENIGDILAVNAALTRNGKSIIYEIYNSYRFST